MHNLVVKQQYTWVFLHHAPNFPMIVGVISHVVNNIVTFLTFATIKLAGSKVHHGHGCLYDIIAIKCPYIHFGGFLEFLTYKSANLTNGAFCVKRGEPGNFQSNSLRIVDDQVISRWIISSNPALPIRSAKYLSLHNLSITPAIASGVGCVTNPFKPSSMISLVPPESVHAMTGFAA